MKRLIQSANNRRKEEQIQQLMMMMVMMITTRASLLLLTAVFISIHPVHSQRQRMAKDESIANSNGSVYKVHLYNYVVQAGTGVNIRPPIRPLPPNLRWSSYAIDKTLEGQRFSSSDEHSWHFNDECRRRLKRPCTEVFSINVVRKFLSISDVGLEQADIIRVFQGTEGGFSSQYVQRRYNPANETASYHRNSDTDEPQMDQFEIKEADNINYAIYLSVYDGHVCSFASKPKVVNRGDTLRLRCQIVLNGFWVPSLYFRNEYDGTVYETNTTACNSPVRPYRYCGLVDVQVEAAAAVLAFACHVRFPDEGRFQPTVGAYAQAKWPQHSHHSPVCYLEKLYIDTIPSDVNFLCDKMPCTKTINVGQEVRCQAEAYPRPQVNMTVAISDDDDDDVNLADSDPFFEEWDKDPTEDEDSKDLEQEEEEEEADARLFLDAEEDVATTASEAPTMEIQQQSTEESGHNTTTSDAEETNTASNSSGIHQNNDSTIPDNSTEPLTAEGTPQTRTTEAENQERETTKLEKTTGEVEVGKPTIATSEVAKSEGDRTETTATSEVAKSEGDRTETTATSEVPKPEGDRTDEGNNTAKGSDKEESGITPGRPQQKDNVDKNEGSGEPDEKETKQKEEDTSDWGSETFKVTEKEVGKILVVTCNISNSLGWGLNVITLQVKPTGTNSTEDETKIQTKNETADEEDRTAKTPRGDGTEGGSSRDPKKGGTMDQSKSDEAVDPLPSSGDHDDSRHHEWRKPVPTEKDGTPRTDKETHAEGKATVMEGSGDSSGDAIQRTQTTMVQVEERPSSATPRDRDSPLALARKFGPREIRVYCNGALCIGAPRLFVGDFLRCEAQGTPEPNVSFMTDGGRVIDSATYQLTEEDRGSMTITCIAKNQYGSMTSRLVLTISARRSQLVKKFRKDDTSAGRSGPQMRWMVVGFSAFLSAAAAHHRLQHPLH